MVDPWWRNLAFTEVACSGVYRAVGRRQRRLRVDFAFSAPLQPSWSSVHWLWPSCSSVHLLLQCKFAAAGLGHGADWRSWLLAARQIWGESTQTKSPEGGTGSVCVHSAQRGRGGSSHYYAAAGIGFENDSHGATCAVGDLSLNCLNPVHSHKITEHFIILVPMSRGVSLTD